MIWWVLAILTFLMILVAVIYIESINENLDSNEVTSESTEKEKYLIDLEEAKKIAEKINTLEQLKALRERAEKSEEKLSEHDGSEKAYDTLSRKTDILDDALGISEDKAFKKQYIPDDMEAFTSLATLKNAYKVVNIDAYEDKKIEFNSKDEDWIDICGFEEPDRKSVV